MGFEQVIKTLIEILKKYNGIELDKPATKEIDKLKIRVSPDVVCDMRTAGEIARKLSECTGLKYSPIVPYHPERIEVIYLSYRSALVVSASAVATLMEILRKYDGIELDKSATKRMNTLKIRVSPDVVCDIGTADEIARKLSECTGLKYSPTGLKYCPKASNRPEGIDVIYLSHRSEEKEYNDPEEQHKIEEYNDYLRRVINNSDSISAWVRSGKMTEDEAMRYVKRVVLPKPFPGTISE